MLVDILRSVTILQNVTRTVCERVAVGGGLPSACALLAFGLGALVPASTFGDDPHELVEAGVRALQRGDVREAEQAFSAAQKLRPDDARIAFDRGCASLAAEHWDEAVEQFRRAADRVANDVANDAAIDAELQSKALYNLGLALTRQAETELGDEPLATDEAQRERALDRMADAAARYRECLRLQPDFRPARRNLEAVRLWCQHMQEAWETYDLQRRTAEQPVLELVRELRDRQRTLVSTAVMLRDAPRRAMWYRQSRTLADEQRQLQEQIPILTEKLIAAAESTANADEPADLQWVRELGQTFEQQMRTAGDALRARELATAIPTQRETYRELDSLFAAIAPVPVLAQDGLSRQQELLGAHEDTLDDSLGSTNEVVEPGDGTERQGPPSLPNSLSLPNLLPMDVQVWEQRALGEIGQTLRLKAQQELAALGQTKPAAKPASDASSDDAQLQAAVQRSLEKAVELAPEIPPLALQAAEALQSPAPETARPNQERIRDIFQEILEQAGQPPPDPSNSDSDQQESNDQQNPDQQDPDEQEPGSDQRQQEDSQQPDRQDTDEPDSQDGDQDKSKADGDPDETARQQQPEDSRDSSDTDETAADAQRDQALQQAEILLQQVRERQRQHRERQKQIMRLLRGRGGVEKDW